MTEAQLTQEAAEQHMDLLERLEEVGQELDRVNTRRRLVDPMLEMLGWPVTIPEDEATVTIDYKVGDSGAETVDYALVGDGSVYALVLVRPLDDGLNKSAREELYAYLHEEDVRLGLLTNGREVEVLQRVDGDDIAGMVYGDLDVNELDENLDVLELMSFSALVSGEGQAIAEETARLTLATEQLEERSDAVVSALTATMAAEIDRVEQEEVRQMTEQYVADVHNHLKTELDELLGGKEVEQEEAEQEEAEQEEADDDGDDGEEVADDAEEAGDSGNEDSEAGETEDTVVNGQDDDDEDEDVVEVEGEDDEDREAAASGQDAGAQRAMSQYLSSVLRREAGVRIEDGEFRAVGSNRTLLDAAPAVVAALASRLYLRPEMLPLSSADGEACLNIEPVMEDGSDMNDPIDLSGTYYINRADNQSSMSSLVQELLDLSVVNERNRSSLTWLSRAEVSGDVDDVVALYPADPEVADGLADGFGAWGGIVIDRQPDWFAIYAHKPVKEIRYLGKVSDVIPVEEYGFEDLSQFNWYDPEGPQKYMVTFSETYRISNPLTTAEDEPSDFRSLQFTTLQEFKSAEDLNSLETIE